MSGNRPCAPSPDPGGPALAAEQERVARLRPPPWAPGAGPVAVGAVAAVHAGDAGAGGTLWAAAVLLTGTELLTGPAVGAPAPAGYVPGLLAAREARVLAEAVAGLAGTPEVLLLAAAGRDHPRGAGLALHLGALLDLPTVGVTDRPLAATGPPPGPRRGDTAPLLLGGTEVARWVRTAEGAREARAGAG